MPCRVSGVTTAPSEMPISTRSTRISSGDRHRPAGERSTGHRENRAGQPAGGCREPERQPAVAAKASVSDRRPQNGAAMRVLDNGADKRAFAEPGAPAPSARSARSMPRAGRLAVNGWPRAAYQSASLSGDHPLGHALASKQKIAHQCIEMAHCVRAIHAVARAARASAA